MLKKTIKYTDYNGKERVEDFYFNLNKTELIEFEVSETGGIHQLIEKIIAEDDHKKLIELFKEFILKSYGEKTPDGKRFTKSFEIKEGFAQTEAYNVLFTELTSDDKAAVAFVNGVIPQPERSN